MFEQVLCDRVHVKSLLPVGVVEIDIVSHWGMLPLPSTVKQKACESSLQAMLIGHTTWKPVRLLEPTECGIQAGVLLGTNALCSSPK